MSSFWAILFSRIHSFFSMMFLQGGSKAKDGAIGRQEFKTLCNAIYRKSGINAKIQSLLREEGQHPDQLYGAAGYLGSSDYTMAFGKIAVALGEHMFGPGFCYVEGAGQPRGSLMPYARGVFAYVWELLASTTKKSVARFEDSRDRIEESMKRFEGEFIR